MDKIDLLEFLKKGDAEKSFSSLIGVTRQSDVISEDDLADILEVPIEYVRRWAKGENLPQDFARPTLIGKIITNLEQNQS